MPVSKHELFSFGGLDSRSNPANYPPNRALRCLNFAPVSSGILRLRSGYSVPSGPTSDGIPIHSAIYYEQFSANYVGPQYILYGKGDNIDILNIQTGMINLAPNDKRLSPPSGLIIADGGTGGSLGAGTYYYVVTSLDGLGGETPASGEVSILIAAGHKPALNWTAVTGATAYNVYRGTSPGAESFITGVDPVNTNSFTDTGAGTTGPTYSIVAINAVGGGSPLANVQLSTASTGSFTPGQNIRIVGTSPSGIFDTIATVTAIADSFNMTVSASIFTVAGTGGGTIIQGPFGPGAWADGGGTGDVWQIQSGVINVFVDDFDPSSGEGGVSNPLLATTFPFQIPASASNIRVLAQVSRNGTQFFNNAFPPPSNLFGVNDVAVQRVKAGVPFGASIPNPSIWPASPQYAFYTWSGGDLSPADVNNVGFGFAISCSSVIQPPPNAEGLIYDVGVQVTYDVPATPTGSTGGTITLAVGSPPVINTTSTTTGNQMGSSNPWGHFRANNKIFISSGAGWSGRFFNSDLQSWDGANLRPVGLPDLSVFDNATGGPAVASVTTSSQGSFTPTTLTGYQLYGAIYNPLTGHVGNCEPLGDRFTIGATQSAVILSGLPNPYFVGSFADEYPEWVLAIGMTNDGGEVPYWLVDANGNNVVIGNSASSGTIYIGNVVTTQQLPSLNNIPPKLDKFARVGTRIFGGLAGNPYLSYSNDAADISNANYVGNPEESWPADQQEPLPTGEVPTSIHSYRLEGWFFSRNNLAIWSQFLLQQGVNPWRGPWPGGCVGQRAFIETPYGPYWFNANKQLCTFMEDGVVSVSEEYEAALLKKIGFAYISLTELAYYKDPATLTDEIMIRGFDSSGNPVIVIHDFLLKDEESRDGQGYQYQYTGVTVNTFVGSGFTPRQNAFDATGKERLWAGSKEGFIAQLEYGDSDNGATYSGDYLGLVSVGPNRPGLVGFEWQGDGNVQFSYSQDYSQTLAGLRPVQAQRMSAESSGVSSRWEAKMTGEARWVYCRVQLTSHPQDGSLALTDPPFIPLPTYGLLAMSVFKTGAERKEGR